MPQDNLVTCFKEYLVDVQACIDLAEAAGLSRDASVLIALSFMKGRAHVKQEEIDEGLPPNTTIRESLSLVEGVRLGPRTINILHREGIITLNDLFQRFDIDILRIPGVGKVAFQEIEKFRKSIKIVR